MQTYFNVNIEELDNLEDEILEDMQKERGNFLLEEFPDQVDDSIRFKDLSVEKICFKYCGNQGSAECVCCPYGRRTHE